MYRLAICYTRGDGVEKDVKHGYLLMETAFKNGYIGSRYDMCRSYYELFKIYKEEKKYITAIKYCTLAKAWVNLYDGNEQKMEREIITALETYDNIIEENGKLKQLVSELQAKLDYAPGNIGYQKAEKEFNEISRHIA